MEDEARQMLVGGIDERRPEMTGAVAVAREDLGEEEARVWRRGRRRQEGGGWVHGIGGWPAAVVTCGAP